MSVRRPPLRNGIGVSFGVSRYDLYLALIPVPLLVGVVAGLAAAVPVAYGAGLGSLASALLLGHGLFRDAPTATPADDRSRDPRGPVPGDD